jgi:hypothetical protein
VNPYSRARAAAQAHAPAVAHDIRIRASCSDRATHELGRSELLRSSHCAASMTFSVRTRPG